MGWRGEWGNQAALAAARRLGGVGRGKRRSGLGLAAVALATPAAVLLAEDAEELELDSPFEPAPAEQPLTLGARPARKRLPDSMKVDYAAPEPEEKILRYAEIHASNVRKGESEGAVKLLQQNLRVLKRGFPAIERLLDALVQHAFKLGRQSPELATAKARATALAGVSSLMPEEVEDWKLEDEGRLGLVEGLRERTADPLAAASAALVRRQIGALAKTAAGAVLAREPEWLLEHWLQPLYLDRFLWKGYGRDYPSYWPTREELTEVLSLALAERVGDDCTQRELLEESVLPELVARCFPKVAELIRSELDGECSFSAKWPLDEERLLQIAAAL